MEKNQSELAKKQQQANWNNAKKNHNLVEYIHYTNLATDQSNETYRSTFWCYFNLHGNTTRMSNDLQTIKTEKKTTPVTIAPSKASLRRINRKVERGHRNWLDIQKFQKYCLKIPEVISEVEEKKFMF